MLFITFGRFLNIFLIFQFKILLCICFCVYVHEHLCLLRHMCGAWNTSCKSLFCPTCRTWEFISASQGLPLPCYWVSDVVLFSFFSSVYEFFRNWRYYIFKYITNILLIFGCFMQKCLFL